LATPVAPWFYYKGATRLESVSFQLAGGEAENSVAKSEETRLFVSAQRDELRALEAQVPLKRTEAE
ncbi:MAG: cofactor assembly of complex C subunit B, partial [Cyanobacteria bacterium P01_F01_bin.86]